MSDRFALMVTVSALLLVAPDALAQGTPAPKPPPQSEPAKAAAPSVEYRPPLRGAPRVRVGGSTRSMNRGLSLTVLAPDHTGLSATDQPELYWYISQPVSTPLEFTLAPADGGDPLVETKIPAVTEAGIQRIRLADHGVKLGSNQEYQWLISFAAKPGSRAKDAIAGGRVRVEPLPSDVARSVKAAGPSGAYVAYAQAGYWYDAVAGLRREMSRRPADRSLLDAQQHLLEQVGLNEIARLERERSVPR